MTILNKYFTRQTVGAFVGLLLVLAGLAWMMQVLTMLKFLMQYGISIGGFLELTTFMIPLIAATIMPFVIFIAILFVYNNLISNNEISTLAATGISPRKIARPALNFTLALAFVHFILNLWLVPLTQGGFYDRQWEMRYGLAHLKLQESAFTQLADGLVVYVGRVAGHDLNQLMIYDSRDKNSEMAVLAEKGKLVNTARGISVVMENGSLQMRGETLTTGTFDSMDMDMNLGTKESSYALKIRRIPTARLLKLREEQRAIPEIASRFLSPLMDVLLALIGLVFLLRTSLLRRRTSFAPAMAVAAMAGAMSLFMTILNILDSMADIYIIGAMQTLLIFTLLKLLPRK